MTTPIRQYLPNAIITVLAAADLQNLANNTSVTGAEYDNTPVGGSGTLGDFLGDLILTLKYNSVSGIAAGTKVADVYLIPCVDGTNYPTLAGSPSIPQKAHWIGALESRAPSTSVVEYLSLCGIVLPPYKFKIVYANVCGQTMKNDTSMIGKLQTYQVQSP